jgi:hypothetical protein
LIDRAPYEIPRRRETLPFIDQDGAFAFQESGRFGRGDLLLGQIIHLVYRVRALECCSRLSNGFRPFYRDSSHTTQKFVQLVINNPADVHMFSDT